MSKENKVEITDEEVWYIVVNNQTRGPLSLRDLDVLLRTNDINSRTFAWKNGMKEWKEFNEIEEIKQSILQSSKEILEIEKKREHLFEKPKDEKAQGQNQENAQNDQIIENKDQNALTILEKTVENLVKKTFHQLTDGKWNVYDEQKGLWVQQDEEPTQKMQMMKQLLFNKLKAQLFFGQKDNKRKKKEAHQQQKKQPQIPLTEQQILKKEKNRKKAKRQAEKKKEKWYNAKINTFIYVSGLPLDITEDQLKHFAIKAGVLRIDLNTGKQKIKIYKDQNGFPKGDAAISFARQQSVEIAIQNLNNSQIRSGFNVKIERASFNQKQDDYKPRQTKKQTMAKKIQLKMLSKKQFSWDDQIYEQGEGLKIVVMKNVLDYKEVDNEVYFESVKKDITEEVTKFGQIQRIRFYPQHIDGIVQVKFKLENSAEQCVSLMNGRFFDGRQIQCDYWDGQTDYKKDAASRLLQQQRLQKFAKELQNQKPSKLQKVGEQQDQQDEEIIDKHILDVN